MNHQGQRLQRVIPRRLMLSPARRISAFMTRPFPQNIIIRRPVPSAFMATVACYLFLMVYQPLGMLRSDYSNYEFTMGVYSLISGSWFIIMAAVIKRISFFREEWTLGREILAILVVIVPLGSIIWAAGFVMEDPEGRKIGRASCREGGWVWVGAVVGV